MTLQTCLVSLGIAVTWLVVAWVLGVGLGRVIERGDPDVQRHSRWE